MVILKVLDSLEKLEAKMADLYERFGTIFKHDAEAAALFERMNLDETAHVNLVRYHRRVISRDMKLFREVSPDIESLQATLARIESVLSGPQPSLQEAVKTAIDLEINAAESHVISALESAAADIAPLLSGLGVLDSKHYGVLEEFAVSRRFSFVSKPMPITETPVLSGAPDREIVEKLPEISSEELERIEYYYKWYITMDYYKVLGVKDYATSNQIKHAFYAVAREFHPDRYPVGDIQRKLHEIFSYMVNAYSTLMEPDKRRKYDLTLKTRIK